MNTRSNALEKSALIFGVVAIGSTMILPVICPLVFGSIAIVLGFLSKGYEIRIPTSAKVGMVLSTIAIIVNLLILCGSIALYLFVPGYKQQFSQVYEQIYGEPFEGFGELENIELPEGFSMTEEGIR